MWAVEVVCRVVGKVEAGKGVEAVLEGSKWTLGAGRERGGCRSKPVEADGNWEQREDKERRGDSVEKRGSSRWKE